MGKPLLRAMVRPQGRSCGHPVGRGQSTPAPPPPGAGGRDHATARLPVPWNISSTRKAPKSRISSTPPRLPPRPPPAHRGIPADRGKGRQGAGGRGKGGKGGAVDILGRQQTKVDLLAAGVSSDGLSDPPNTQETLANIERNTFWRRGSESNRRFDTGPRIHGIASKNDIPKLP